MSESCCGGGESSYSSYSSYSYNRSSHSQSSVELPSTGESSHVSHSSFSPSLEKKPDYETIKKVLLGIEQVVTKEFSSEEKNKFLTEYRKIIVDNEKEIVAMPNASFFINKFNRNEDLTHELKVKIINGLKECIEEDKAKNAQLKYW